MTDLQIIAEAARRNGEAINKSVWMGESERRFLSNAFLAFADEIRNLVIEAKRAKDAEVDRAAISAAQGTK
jgi:hypothetical protein